MHVRTTLILLVLSSSVVELIYNQRINSMKNFLAPPMTQAYFQFKAGDQMRYYKRMRVVTQSGFPSVIITPYCAVCERSNQVLVVGGGGVRSTMLGAKFVFASPCANQRGSELLVTPHLHSKLRIHRSSILPTILSRIPVSEGTALRVLANPSSCSQVITPERFTGTTL